MDPIVITPEFEVLFIIELLQIICTYLSTADLISIMRAFPFFRGIIKSHIRDAYVFLLDMTGNELTKLKKDSIWNVLLKNMARKTCMGKEINFFPPRETYYTLIIKSGIIRPFSRALHDGNLDVIKYFLKEPAPIDLLSIMEVIKPIECNIREYIRLSIIAMWGCDPYINHNIEEFCRIKTIPLEYLKKSICIAPCMTYWQMKDIFAIAYSLKKTLKERHLLDSMITKFKNLLIHSFGDFISFGVFIRDYINEYVESKSVIKRRGSIRMITKFPIVFLTIFMAQTKKMYQETINLIQLSIKDSWTSYRGFNVQTLYMIYFQISGNNGSSTRYWRCDNLVNDIIAMLPEEPIQRNLFY